MNAMGAAMDEVLFRALVAAGGVAMLAGLLGAFVVWRRMAYVGDAMGHGALFGVVGGLIIGLNPTVSVVLVAMLFGLLLTWLGQDRRLPFDAMLVVLSTGGLAGGLVLVDWLPGQVDVFSYLFGDILAISIQDIWVIVGSFILLAGVIAATWRPLLRTVLHPDVARVEGVPVHRLNLMLTAMIALTVAVALQVVGVLLITALLVIPPLAARAVAKTPRQMVLSSMFIGFMCSGSGVLAAWHFDKPVGPCIVLAAVAVFAVSRIAARA